MARSGKGFRIARSATVLFFLLAGASAAEDVARGKVIVSRDCSGCHAVGTTGVSPNPRAPQFRRLNERYDVEALAEGLAEGLTVGHGPMPEWTFAPDDVSAIVAFLQSIQARKGSATGPRSEPKP